MTGIKSRYLSSRSNNNRRHQHHARAPVRAMRAILATCQRTFEERCSRELINLLSTLIEGQSNLDLDLSESCTESCATMNASPVSIQDALEKERLQLSENTVQSGLHKLDAGGVSGMVLIQVDIPNVEVVDLVRKAFQYLHQFNRPITRYIERLIPIQFVFRANPSELQSAVAELIPVQFKFLPENESFSCKMQSRCNDLLERTSTITSIAAAVVPTTRPVDLADPHHIIELQVIKNVAGLSCISRIDYDQCYQWKWRQASEALVVVDANKSHLV